MKNIENHIVERILQPFPNVRGIYLFGSRATGKHRPDSDFDVAVLGEETLKNDDRFFALQLELAALFDPGVQLMDFRTLPTVLKFEVLKGRKRLFVPTANFVSILRPRRFRNTSASTKNGNQFWNHLSTANSPMLTNKLLGKIINLQTCLRRIREVYPSAKQVFLNDLLLQESVLLNLQRACKKRH